MRHKLELLRDEAAAAFAAARSEADLQQVKGRYLGPRGLVTGLLKHLRDLPAEELPLVGRLANEVKLFLEGQVIAQRQRLKDERLSARMSQQLDLTLPGRRPWLGHQHPIAIVQQEIESIFIGLGFEIVEGPEVELDYYNFEALNMPADHPARDMQDTFYLPGGFVLRTHTSAVQVRVMEKRQPPVRIIAPGRVYRRDHDLTHTPMFHQVEGLLVDRGIRFSHLKGTLEAFAHRMFGPDTPVRFRPSFFPYTEPSAEVDIGCVMCGGRGCRVCSHSGWLEILGAGMVDPAVYEFVNYDSEEFTGFAFGMGIERIAMLRFGINDLRLFFENDLRFLRQF
ncbi:MAG: phenylalanine--tRNA ligase subunit alpha [Candidatus Tectomicrobia bacterium]|nr:phenylalanine--tRNA ligase subunit alpha [Candidatus Tectomicrobia bacterium]